MPLFIMFDELRNILIQFIELNPNEIVNEILEDSELQKWILDLNRQLQLFEEGVDSENKFLGTYAPFTYEHKLRKFGTEFPRHITLLEEGKFYDSFKIILNPEDFIITANPIREDTNLFEKYGEEIVGLTDESMELLRERLLSLIQQAIKNKIDEIISNNR